VITSPRIPRNRHTANESKANRKVTSSTRSGTRNQRSGADGTVTGGMPLDCSAAIPSNSLGAGSCLTVR
jgi:hypothetical protein